MDRIDEMIGYERRLRSLAREWMRLETSHPATDLARAAIGEAISRLLAELQMIVERHVAETEPEYRAAERYLLGFQLPAFTTLKRWHHLFYPPEPTARPA